jgi:glycosyltransferase involved in cell wall biosynthesis
MIYLGFPYGSNFGWGVLGREVALALAQLTEMRLLSPPNADQRLDDEFDRFQISKLLASAQEHGRQLGDAWELDGPVIQTAVGRGLMPFVPHLVPPAHVGYAVFEDTILPQAVVAQLREQYRHVAAGSTYCAEILRRHGLTEVSTVLHGVDTTLFCPRPEPRSFLKDRFIVFSGGKFELRKGQDIVIRAYKVFQDRHRDVMLVNSWSNNWPSSRDTMSASKLIHYIPPKNNDHTAWMNYLLSAHGIDLDRVITVGPRDHRLLPRLYHATDLGLFPNRAEGGNNMVLMEYLACGKPALVSYNSGHTDIVSRKNAVLIEGHRPMQRHIDDELTAFWSDPSVDETIDKLEWCYQHRDQLQPLGQQAAEDMRQFSWTRVAHSLLQCVRQVEATL